jgi:hypothetical protein
VSGGFAGGKVPLPRRQPGLTLVAELAKMQNDLDGWRWIATALTVRLGGSVRIAATEIMTGSGPAVLSPGAIGDEAGIRVTVPGDVTAESDGDDVAVLARIEALRILAGRGDERTAAHLARLVFLLTGKDGS